MLDCGIGVSTFAIVCSSSSCCFFCLSSFRRSCQVRVFICFLEELTEGVFLLETYMIEKESSFCMALPTVFLNLKNMVLSSDMILSISSTNHQRRRKVSTLRFPFSLIPLYRILDTLGKQTSNLDFRCTDKRKTLQDNGI